MSTFIRYILLTLFVVQLLGCVPNVKDPYSGITEPRKNHYIFAHNSLPFLLFTKTDKTLEELEFNGQVFVNNLWMGISGELSKQGLPIVEPNGLKMHKEYINHVNLYLVEMPAPIGMTESYYVVISVKDNVPRYFTLELTAKGMCDGRDNPTVFGEWTSQHKHINYGCGPIPDKNKMLERVVKQI